MADRDRTRLTAWTIAGIAVVTITLVLAAAGMVLAIRQTQLLASKRVADLKPEARRISAEINATAEARLRKLLENLSANWRTSFRRPPFGANKPPAWIDEVYFFDSNSHVIIWRRTGQNQWEAVSRLRWPKQGDQQAQAAVMARLFPSLIAAEFDPHSRRVEFIHDVENAVPLVIAHMTDMQGVNGRAVVAARMNV
ncbi:MAG: hypothetical protein GXP29_10000, partial [Planctomycetes bacterium]|nr:hypothetical protein [Planctomycetota bacterium]